MTIVSESEHFSKNQTHSRRRQSRDALRRQMVQKAKISGATIISPKIAPIRPLSPQHGLKSLKPLNITLKILLWSPRRPQAYSNMDLSQRA